MAYTYEMSNEFNYPNISIYNRYWDGEPSGWRINANEGYVFYDTTEELFEPKIDPDTGLPMEDENGMIIEVPMVQYFRVAYLPRNYNFDNFSYVAVPEDDVDPNYIFGVGGNNNNNHEVI